MQLASLALTLRASELALRASPVQRPRLTSLAALASLEPLPTLRPLAWSPELSAAHHSASLPAR
jgi:hypothetical protein